MMDIILVMNAGSSSIKFALYPADSDTRVALVKGKIAGIGSAPDFIIRDAEKHHLPEDELESIEPTATHAELTVRLLDWIQDHTAGYTLRAVGHRVVHGGRTFTAPVEIDADVMTSLKELVSLAPLHQPNNLAVIESIVQRHPGLPQLACFDTSFHRTQPRLCQLFALPGSMTDAGIIRYGFHGLSYEYIASTLPEIAGDVADQRVIVAHLGNGSSMCAMKNRQSVSTTMGFTALEGLMMGRRCGTLDAGVVLHMMDQMGMSSREVTDVLYRQSGLLGVSGISNDMHVLENSTDPQAQEAVELYCHRAATQLASLVCTINGLDALVFTAGIGENSSLVRQKICEQLGWLGVSLDNADNKANATLISDAASSVRVYIIPTDEEAVIASAVRLAVS